MLTPQFGFLFGSMLDLFRPDYLMPGTGTTCSKQVLWSLKSGFGVFHAFFAY